MKIEELIKIFNEILNEDGNNEITKVSHPNK